MPYIPPKARHEIVGLYRTADTPGELNFRLTEDINQYIFKHGLSYHTLNEIIGALECAKLELYRRIAVPYEDKKITENGDVYTVEI